MQSAPARAGTFARGGVRSSRSARLSLRVGRGRAAPATTATLLPACCTPSVIFQSSASTTAAVAATSLLTYLAWDSWTSFNLSHVTDVLTLRKGAMHAAQQVNKAVSVAGLVLVALAFLPAFASQYNELLRNALVMLGGHVSSPCARVDVSCV